MAGASRSSKWKSPGASQKSSGKLVEDKACVLTGLAPDASGKIAGRRRTSPWRLARRVHRRLDRRKLCLTIPDVPGFGLGRLAPVDVRAEPKFIDLANTARPLSATLACVAAGQMFPV